MQRSILTLLLLVPALAGCLNGADEIESNGSNVGLNEFFESPFKTVESSPDHNHSDPMQHDIVNNMTLEAFLPLGDNGAPGSISEMHVANDFLFQGVMGYGFQIIDISNPLNPILVTSYDMSEDGTDDDVDDARGLLGPVRENCIEGQPCPGAPGIPSKFYLADLKSDEAGDWLYVALEVSSNPGVFIYDVRDKENPVFAGFWPQPGAPPGAILGCHMVEYAMIDGTEYLFCAPLDDSVYVGQISDPGVDGVRNIETVARWFPAGADDTPRQAQTIPADPAGLGEYSLLGGHQDMTWQVDPIGDSHLLSVSLWDLGWYWVDVSNPLMPTTVGEWHGDDSPDYGGRMHTAMLTEHDGRRIAVGIPEVAEIPVVHILDVTDFSQPVVLSHWNGLADWEGEHMRYSTHNFQVVNGLVYMTHYHAGTIVLDISTDELLEAPHMVGTYTPMDRREESYGSGFGGSWDVLVWEGYAYTANQGGLHVIHQNGEPVTDGYSGFA